MGTLNCLSVSEGDIKISFDTQNTAEAIRAKRMINDMLKRGYALLVQLEDGTHQRAKAFDEKCGEYIIADYDPEVSGQGDMQDVDKEATPEIKEQKRRGPKPGARRVPMEQANVTAVARTAGG